MKVVAYLGLILSSSAQSCWQMCVRPLPGYVQEAHRSGYIWICVMSVPALHVKFTSHAKKLASAADKCTLTAESPLVRLKFLSGEDSSINLDPLFIQLALDK